MGPKGSDSRVRRPPFGTGPGGLGFGLGSCFAPGAPEAAGFSSFIRSNSVAENLGFVKKVVRFGKGSSRIVAWGCDTLLSHSSFESRVLSYLQTDSACLGNISFHSHIAAIDNIPPRCLATNLAPMDNTKPSVALEGL
jgi:hypothetical protein